MKCNEVLRQICVSMPWQSILREDAREKQAYDFEDSLRRRNLPHEDLSILQCSLSNVIAGNGESQLTEVVSDDAAHRNVVRRLIETVDQDFRQSEYCFESLLLKIKSHLIAEVIRTMLVKKRDAQSTHFDKDTESLLCQRNKHCILTKSAIKTHERAQRIQRRMLEKITRLERKLLNHMVILILERFTRLRLQILCLVWYTIIAFAVCDCRRRP